MSVVITGGEWTEKVWNFKLKKLWTSYDYYGCPNFKLLKNYINLVCPLWTKQTSVQRCSQIKPSIKLINNDNSWKKHITDIFSFLTTLDILHQSLST